MIQIQGQLTGFRLSLILLNSQLKTMNKGDQSRPSPRIKVALLGDQGAGKTTIINCCVNKDFVQDYQPTTSIDFFMKNVECNGEKHRLQLWDSSGNEKFRFLTTNFVKNADCAIIVLDISSEEQLVFQSILQNLLEKEISKWITLFEENNIAHGFPVLVGNKKDENRRKFSCEMIRDKAEKMGLIYVEVSAKTGQNIELLFQTIVDECEKRRTKKRVKSQRKRRNSQGYDGDSQLSPGKTKQKKYQSEVKDEKESNTSKSSHSKNQSTSSNSSFAGNPLSSYQSPKNKPLGLCEKQPKMSEMKQCQCLIM